MRPERVKLFDEVASEIREILSDVSSLDHRFHREISGHGHMNPIRFFEERRLRTAAETFADLSVRLAGLSNSLRTLARLGHTSKGGRRLKRAAKVTR